MFRIMNDYMRVMKLTVDDEIKTSITNYISGLDSVGFFDVTLNYNRYNIDIRLKKYSVDNAKMEFEHLIDAIGYAYSSMYVRYNEGSVVRYRFATCKENKEGFYCDIVFS